MSAPTAQEWRHGAVLGLGLVLMTCGAAVLVSVAYGVPVWRIFFQ